MRYIFIIALVCASCSTNERITDPKDYSKFLTRSRLTNVDNFSSEMAFWRNRLANMPGDHVSVIKMAGIYASLFRKYGDVADIHKSDSLYQLALSKDKSAELFQALATNAVTQHEFRKAKGYIEEALGIGSKKNISYLILTDIELELGSVGRAESILKGYGNKNSFAYLIRRAKLMDQSGHLDSAIAIMEIARERAKNSKEKMQWTLSNLGDMYSHAGRIKDAYSVYMQALEKDPEDLHCLKGIAWILLSHERNTNEAKKIIQNIAARKAMPESHLMLAEAAALEGNDIEERHHVAQFVYEIGRAGYRKMYNKYLCDIYNDYLNRPDLALKLAEEEIANRPTALSFDLKAWSLYKLGRYSQSLSVVNDFVNGKTTEPVAMYHMGLIYLANGDDGNAKRFLDEAKMSVFELGPAIATNIDSVLQKL